MKKHITNEKKLNNFKEKFETKKYGNIHVLADFDRTLTYGTNKNGERRPSLISVLRNGDYLSENYAERAHALYDKYHPIEVDPNISEKEKREAMYEWWKDHDELLKECGFKKEHLEDIVEDSGIRFRKGVKRFLDFLYKKEIPLVIISASGAGEAIPMFFEKKKVNYPNIHFVVNEFRWDEEGFSLGFQEPIIYSLNKDETVLSKFPEIHEKIKDRKDVVLLGDSEGDVDMVTGFDYNNLLKIGFLSYEITEERKEKFKEVYDIILEGDGDFGFVNELFKV